MANPELAALKADTHVPAWHCLAYSLDVSPASLGVDHFLRLSASSLDMARQDDPDWLNEMHRRWLQLSEALGDNKALRADKRRSDVELDTALLWGAFLELAHSKRWKLPAALKPARQDAAAKSKQPVKKAAAKSKTGAAKAKSKPRRRQK